MDIKFGNTLGTCHTICKFYLLYWFGWWKNSEWSVVTAGFLLLADDELKVPEPLID